MCFPTTAHTRTTSETLEWLQISMWCYIRHIKIKSMFINTVSSCVFQYVHCTSEVLSSEVSFPEELFEDGFIARSRQAGEAPQSRFLVGVVLPPSWGQQRGVGAPASCRTVWWLVSHHQGHTVVGTSFQASARRRMGSRFERLESCWKREMNICWWITSEAFYITGVKKKNCSETWCEGVWAMLFAEPLKAAGYWEIRGGGRIACSKQAVTHPMV